jgi:AcrR family transcriptional regulator
MKEDLAKASRIDGRTARGQRTRAKLVATVLEMVGRGELRLTAPSIASAAGVSIRSLFQHFPELEKLWVAAADRALELTLPMLAPLPGDGAFDVRLRAFLEQRGRMLEITTPMRRAANVLAPSSQEMQLRYETARKIGLDEIDQSFGVELARLDEAERPSALHALEIATNWAAWHTLRGPIGLSPDDARDVMAHAIRALLAPARDR